MNEMKSSRAISRRRFAKDVSLAIGAAGLLGNSLSVPALAAPTLKKRPLGKTGLMVSEISLGGHIDGPEAAKKNATSQEVRTSVIKRAYELGINYFDMNNIPAEHVLTGVALESLGLRDKIYLVESCKNLYKTREETRTKIVESVANNLQVLRTSYADVLRFTSTVTDWDADIIRGYVEAGQELKRQGKVRHLALSSHFPEYLKRVLNEFPEIEVIYTPYNFVVRKAADEVFPSAKEKGVGVVCIKPFLKATMFGLKGNLEQQVATAAAESGHKIADLPSQRGESVARANLRFILANPNVSCVVPGMEIPSEVEENVSASTGPLTNADLDLMQKHVAFRLPGPEYAWLHDWRIL